jgi:hypothetical protein
MYHLLLPTDNLLVPQSEIDFDELVDELVRRFELPDKTHAAVVLANTIQRLPADQCYSTLNHFGNCILKSIGYSVALHKSRMLNQRQQIDVIAQTLKSNPHDQQALDALESASKEGSEYAKEVLSLYRPVDAGDNVVQMTPLASDENKGHVL